MDARSSIDTVYHDEEDTAQLKQTNPSNNFDESKINSYIQSNRLIRNDLANDQFTSLPSQGNEMVMLSSSLPTNLLNYQDNLRFNDNNVENNSFKHRLPPLNRSRSKTEIVDK